MIRRTLAVLAPAAVFAFAPIPAQSQIYLGPEVAWSDDFDFGVGAGVEFGLPQLAEGASFMGDFLYFWEGDDFNYLEFNANLTYDLPLEDVPFIPFGLAGVNVGRVSFDDSGVSGVGGSETEVGLNVGGGVKFDVGNFRPWVLARIALGGTESFTISAFLPFRLRD